MLHFVQQVMVGFRPGRLLVASVELNPPSANAVDIFGSIDTVSFIVIGLSATLHCLAAAAQSGDDDKIVVLGGGEIESPPNVCNNYRATS